MVCRIERFCETTHTFDLPVEEVTITPSNIVALIGLRWEGRVIHFDVYLDMFFNMTVTHDRVEALLSVPPPMNDRLVYTSLETHWCQVTDITRD